MPSCPTTGSAADFLPHRWSLPQLRSAVQTCKGCDLYCQATQAVFGEGARSSTIMFIGEQPGDKEDLAGKPFVGPSGQLLDRTMEAADIDRAKAYVTNAVKHFKFQLRGKRRIHSKPSSRQIAACRPWLEAEFKVVQPKLIICLGATAAQSIFGPAFRITKERGKAIDHPHWGRVITTVHPSAVLRAPDEATRQQAERDFAHDLKLAARELAQLRS